MLIGNKAAVLLSGGQDSTTCLLWAIANFGQENVLAIGFNYGQKHAIELEQAQKIARKFRVPYIIKDIRGLTAASALTDHSADINAASPQDAELPASFTAGRNALFLTIAASYAYENVANNIVTGVCQTDYSGYPDCRYEFIEAQEKALQLALNRPNMRIHTPLMWLTKAETWKLAKELSPLVGNIMYSVTGGAKDWTADPSNDDYISAFEIVRRWTLTDYNGNTTLNEWGMGIQDNPASKLRAKGYAEAREKGWLY